MNTGLWNKWVPLEGLALEYYTDSIAFYEGGRLEFVLSDGKEEALQISYENTVLAYRVSDESWRAETLYEVSMASPGQWVFFIVEPSPYGAAYEAPPAERAVHFAFVMADLMVEVLALAAPRVERKVRGLHGGPS